MERRITLQPGTEINNGYHEDSEPYIVNEPVEVIVIGEVRNGALPIQIVDNATGQIYPDVLYYHQPVVNSPNDY